MAIANKNDLSHIVRTTQQWTTSYDSYECIPKGVLCVEFTPDGHVKAKIGNGHDIFSKLPYIGGADLTNYYTKSETAKCVEEIIKANRFIRIKGILQNKDRLPSNADCGDLYFVISQNQSSSNKYDEYVYSPSNTWENLGSIPIDIDLSEYAKIVYVDEKIDEVNERIDDIEQHGTHTHANKDILDLITAAFTAEEKDKLSTLYNYDDSELRELITQASHTHSNKDILDAISAPFTKEDKAKLDQLNPYDDSILKEKITALERLAHEHSNKRILDRTTASFTTEYERKMRWIRIYTGCTGMEEGIAGLVPAAQAGEEDYVLSGSGEWVPQTGGGGTYELPIATASTLGGIKVGDGLEIDANGKLSVIGGGSGDTITQGGGINVTTDPQTHEKIVSVNTGTGLAIDQQTGELYVTGGGGGDSITEGGGISITTDPQTGVKTISVNTGDHLEVDENTSELNVTDVDYEAGQGIHIGSDYTLIEYIKNSGNYDQIILTDIIPNFSDKIEIDMKIGAAVANTVWDKPIFGCSGSTPSSYRYSTNLYLASNDSNISCYNHFTYESGNTGSNFFIRPSGVSYDGTNAQRQTLTMSGSTATLGNVSKNFSNEINNSFIDPQIGIAIFGNISDVGTKNYFNQCNLTVYGVKLYDSNDTLLHDLRPAERGTDGEAGLYDLVTHKFYDNAGNGSFVKGPPLSSVDDRLISAKIGNGLQFDSNDAIEVNTGDGLSVNQDNELDINTGDGLSINNNNEIELDKATTTTIGGVIVGDNLSIDNDGTLSADEYTPGEGISIDSNKEVSVKYNSDGLSINASDELELDKATKNSIGGVIVGDNIDVTDGTISVPIATDSSLGVVKPTDGLSIDNNGELSVNIGTGLEFDQVTGAINVIGGSGGDTVEAGDGIDIDTDSQTGNKVISVVTGNGLEINNDNEVELTPATQNSIGGIKVGDNLNISSDGTLSAEDETVYHPGDAISFINDAIQDLVVEHEEYYFDTQVTCELHGDFNRTFQKTTADPALGVIWKCYDNNKLWAGPLFVGLTPNSVKYNTNGATYNAKGSFEYLNATWYYGDTTYYVSNIQNQDFAGNMQVFTNPYATVSDEIQAAKDLIDAAGIIADGFTINVKYGDGLILNQNNELEVNIGDGLTLDANDKITIDENIVPLTHYFPGTAISFDQQYSEEIDIWNNGTGWANGAYTSSTGNSYLAGFNLEYHSPIGNNSLEVPTNVNRLRVIALSANDDVLSVTVHCLDDSHNRYLTLYDNTQPYDDWIDLDASARYVNFGVRWTLNSNVGISASDIKSVTLYWQSSGSGDLDINFMNINVNYGDGLTVNQDNELEVNIDAGDGIDITTDSQTGNKVISAIVQEHGGLTIDEDTNGLKLDQSAAGKAINISDEITFDSWNNGTGWANEEYYDNTSNTHIPWNQNLMIYPSSTDVLFRIPDGVTQAKCSATSVNSSIALKTGLYFYNEQGVHFAGPTRSTDPDTIIDIPAGSVYVNQSIRNVNDSNVFSSNVAGATITWVTGGTKIDVKYGTGLTLNQDNELEVNIGDGLSIDPDTGAINVTGGGGGGDSIAEGDGITITTDSQTGVKTIGVNAGTGLDIDPITNELFVNGQLPEGTIIKKLTYVGTGTTTNSNIHFSKKPLSILSLNGSVGQNYGSVISTPIDSPYVHGVYGGSSVGGTSFRSSMSYDDTTNTLSIINSNDAGLAFNISGTTYTMYYLTKGHAGSGTSVNNEVSVVKSFSYVGTGTATNNIQFPETPDMILDINGPLGSVGNISVIPIELKHPTSTAQYIYLHTPSGSPAGNIGAGHGTYSFNDTTNVLTLTAVDYGASMNYSGLTYQVHYIVNEVIASSNYVEGDGIEIDPDTGEISVNIGTGLAFDPQTGAINVTGGGGSGDTVAEGDGISINTDQRTGDKVIGVNAGTGLQVNQTTNELEVSSGVVTSISPTQNTPGSITVTEGDGTATPVSVISQMSGATSSTAGTAGYVPAPAAGDDDAYLRGDGTWDDSVVTEDDELTLVFVPDDYQPS